MLHIWRHNPSLAIEDATLTQCDFYHLLNCNAIRVGLLLLYFCFQIYSTGSYLQCRKFTWIQIWSGLGGLGSAMIFMIHTRVNVQHCSHICVTSAYMHLHTNFCFQICMQHTQLFTQCRKFTQIQIRSGLGKFTSICKNLLDLHSRVKVQRCLYTSITSVYMHLRTNFCFKSTGHAFNLCSVENFLHKTS